MTTVMRVAAVPASQITVAAIVTQAASSPPERQQIHKRLKVFLGWIQQILSDVPERARLEMLLAGAGPDEMVIAAGTVAAGLPTGFILPENRDRAIESLPAELRQEGVRLLRSDTVRLEIGGGPGAASSTRRACIAAADVLVILGPASPALHRQIKTVSEGGKALVVATLPANGATIWTTVQHGRMAPKQPLSDLRPTIMEFCRTSGFPSAPDFPKRVPRYTIGGIFPLVIHLIAGSSPTSRWFHTAPTEREQESALAWPSHPEVWFNPAEAAALAELRSMFLADFVAADSAAIYYSNLFRTICLCIVLLNAAAVACALMVFLNAAHRYVWEVAEIASLLAALALYVTVKRARLQRSWIEHRLLAEMLRSVPYAAAVGEYFETREPDTGDLATWKRVVAEFRRVVRRARTPRLAFTSGYLHGMRALILRYVEAQMFWHRHFARKHHRYHQRLVRIASTLFWAGLTVSATQAALNLLHANLDVWQGARELVPKAVMWAACLCGASGFGASVILHQLGFAHIADRSDGTARRFEHLLREMEADRTPATVERLRHWLAEAVLIAMDEQVGWYKQVVKMSLHL